MPFVRVDPVCGINPTVFCRQVYPGHPKGCPNWNHKTGCPPKVQPAEDIIDLRGSVFAVYNRFDLGAHIAKMRVAHPAWSERQLACCLYWQPRARKQLVQELSAFLSSPECHSLGPPRKVLSCPEANGVDVTRTMANAGIKLEWPPKQWAYQVVLVGRSIETKDTFND